MSDKKNNWWMQIDPKTDIESMDGILETKELLESNDELPASFAFDDEAFFDRLHDKIMAEVESDAVQIGRKPFWLRYSRMMRGSVAAVALMALVLAGVETQQNRPNVDSSEIVLNDVVEHAPDVDNTILVYQSKDDFFVDLARESFNHLSEDNLAGLVHTESL